MTNLDPYGPLDEAQQPDGDTYFKGVNERLRPWQLPPGLCSSGKNLRFTDGRAVARGASLILRCMQTDGTVPWTETYGAAMFEDPNGGEWIMVAADGAIWKTQVGGIASQVSIPATETAISADTFAMFIQCMDVLILLRGAGADPLVLRDIAGSFERITQTASGTGTLPIPRASYGIYHLNTLRLIYDRDQIVVSDVLDYTRYSPVENQFRINEGNDDSLVALYPFGKTTMISFKDQSILKSVNDFGDLAEAFTDSVTRFYGCKAPVSIADSGQDLFWLSELGVTTLGLTQENEANGTVRMLSDDLPKTFKRVNWQYAGNSKGTYWNSRYYIALPIGDATRLSVADYIADRAPASRTYSTAEPNDPIYNVATGSFTVSTTAGETYRYAPGSNDFALANGSDIYYGPVDFVASGASVTLTGVYLAESDGSMQQVLDIGILNGVAVYDSINREWAGLDEVDTQHIVDVRAWLKVTLAGRKQLACLTGDGFLRTYDQEDAFEDEYQGVWEDSFSDVVIADFTALGGADSIARGTTISDNSTVQDATHWKTKTISQAQAEANRTVAASLTTDLVHWQAVQRWNGVTPQVTGSGGIPLLQLERGER